MKHVILRLLFSIFLATACLQAEAEMTRIAVIYAEADDSGRAFKRLLGGIEKTRASRSSA